MEQSLGYLRIDLTDNCNLRCVMCQGYNTVPMSQTTFLDFDVFKRQTDGWLAPWTTIQLGNTAEPTIHPKFGAFVQWIRDQSDATIYIVTNGQLLHRYADVINQGQCLVQVSTNSLEKSRYEAIMRGAKFDRLMRNLSLLDTSRTNVFLSATLMNSNIDEFQSMTQFCKQRGFRLAVFPVILRTDPTKTIPHGLLRESLWFRKDKIRTWITSYYGHDFDGLMIGAASGAAENPPDIDTCDAHRKDLIINGHGDTKLCWQVSLPNLYGMPLDGIWNHEDANRFRKEVDETRNPCRDCDYLRRCLAPSMTVMDNHFSEHICSLLSPATRQALQFDSPLSDEDQFRMFVRDLRKTCSVVKVWQEGRVYYGFHVSSEDAALLDYDPIIRDSNSVVVANSHREVLLKLGGPVGQFRLRLWHFAGALFRKALAVSPDFLRTRLCRLRDRVVR